VNSIKNSRFSSVAAAIVALLLYTAIALPVFGVEAEEGGDVSDTLITVEYRYTEGEAVPTVPQTILEFGREYALVRTAEPVLEAMLPVTRTYTYTVAGVVSKEDMKAIAGLGNVSLQPTRASVEQQIDKTEVIENLPTNDVEYLPQTKEYEIQSDAYEGAVTKGALSRAGVEFKLVGYDEYGLPDNYTATVTYRGIETYLEPQYYNAEATYTTRANQSVPTYVIVAEYEASDKAVVTDPVILEPEEPEADIEDDNTPLTAREILTIVAISLGSVVIAFLIAALLVTAVRRRSRKKTKKETET
jgi:hypothetical protein